MLVFGALLIFKHKCKISFLRNQQKVILQFRDKGRTRNLSIQWGVNPHQDTYITFPENATLTIHVNREINSF